jgi:hypothetical protein
MISGKEVTPKKWSGILNLYDDGVYSAIWGNYDSAPKRSLGVRWNGDDNNIGYPKLAAHPVWYNEADFLVKSILLELCARVSQNNSIGNKDNIFIALSECEMEMLSAVYKD